MPPSSARRAVFVDAGAFYGQLDRRDRRHAEATQGFVQLGLERRPLVTTNLVAGETYALLRTKLGHPAATQWLRTLDDVNVVYERAEDHHDVRALLERYEDKAFSYADAFSFLVMERFRMTTAFAFDAHFRQYGIQTFPIAT